MAELIGFSIAILIIIVVGYVLIVFVLPVVLALGSAVVAAVAAAACVIGLFSALKNYITAIRDNMNFQSWEWEKGDEPAQRSYFFGPGYAQLMATIQAAFRLNALSGVKIRDTRDKIEGLSDGWLGLFRKLCGLVYMAVAFVCVFGFGTVLCAVLGLIHGTITTLVMAGTYLVFTVVWLLDRSYLQKNRIRSDCPACHSRFLVPSFACPDCGRMHHRLVPGPYGIWKHKCECGKILPSTFMNGRSKLAAYCPDCGASLVASDARPVVFQLIGGSKAGKTVYLSAFFHQYRQKLAENSGLRCSITEEYQPYFDDLEQWYGGTECPATAQMNSQMYPILIDSQLGIRRQFSIYDIAGEMFDGHTADSVELQQQFHYCDGLLFLIDPFSCGRLRDDRLRSSGDISDFSDMPAEDVAGNFINYLYSLGHARPNELCRIPVAVLIAKADIREVKREIGPARIASQYRNHGEEYGSYENARDSLCRQFLVDIGLSETVDQLETQFATLHYFPVSAMGHSADGTAYEPWGVMESVEWMLPLADKELAELITPPAAANA